MYLNRLSYGNVIPRWLLLILLSTCFSSSSFSNDMKKDSHEAGTYSKIYWIKADPSDADGIFDYFDSVITPQAKESKHHAGLIYQMIATGPGEWLLIANYQSKESAEAAVPWVGKIITPMVENLGMTLEPITAGDIFRLVKKD